MALAASGGIFMIVGFVDFFSAFGGSNQPSKFWCFFVGMPLLFFGLVMLKFGYMGAVARYMAGEAAPVMKDTFNYMARGTREGVRDIASAVGEGLRGEGAETAVSCHKCGHANDGDANFCDECGSALASSTRCSSCGESNDADAKFCDSCGQSLTASG
jgi:hypothetical protein